MYNAKIKIVYRDARKLVFRVYPESGKFKYVAGQYGALGLSNKIARVDGIKGSNGHESLIKRAYSLSSSILDERQRLIEAGQTDYYEFYANLVLADEQEKPRLSSRLFSLKDGDPIFIGPKIVGHHTLQSLEKGRNVLFIATTTGEAPHNAMIHELLGRNSDCRIAHLVLSEGEWVSAYAPYHQTLMAQYSNYRYMGLAHDAGYAEITQRVAQWLADTECSRRDLGWAVNAGNTHVYLCGDPKMIGAPVKLGGWKYDYPDYGLMRILGRYQFSPLTRFQQGNISHEAYW